MNTEQCNLLQTRISLQLRKLDGSFSQLFPQILLKTDPAGTLGRSFRGSFGLKRPTSEQRRFFREKGCLGFGPFLDEGRVRQIGEAIDAIAGGEVPYPPELIRWEPVSQGSDLGRSAERKKFAVVRGRRCGEVV